MKHLHKTSKIILLMIGFLLLTSFLFPPWVEPVRPPDLYKFAGYKFIFTKPIYYPPPKPNTGRGIPGFVNPFDPLGEQTKPETMILSIDFSRLILQSIAIILAGTIAVGIFTWWRQSSD